MTVTLPAELEDRVQSFARQRGQSPEALVRDALQWYLQMEPELLDEFDAWEAVRDEAWRVAEEAVS